MTLQPLLEANWLTAILPEIVLSLGGMLLILFAAIVPRLRGLTAPLCLIIFTLAAYSETFVTGGLYFGRTWEISALTMIFDMTFLLAGMLATLFAREYLEREKLEAGEFYALLLWGTVGMMM